MKKEISGEVSALIRQLELRQRRSLISFLLGLIVVFTIAVVIVAASYLAVRNNLRSLALAKQEIKTLEGKIGELEKELDLVNKNLRLAIDFTKYKFSGDWALALKYLYGRREYRKQSELLNDILVMVERGVGWKLGGLSPGDGFDSPSFVAFLLEKHGLLGHYRAVDVRYRLDEVIQSTSRPGMGDVVFYLYGYTMFYFKIPREEPFVIGMTPLGIHALRLNFVNIIRFGRIDYPRY